MDFKHILVVIDPTSQEEAQPSLIRAEEVSERYPQAAVTLFICDYNSALDGGILFATPGLEKARASLIDSHLRQLDKLAAPLRERGVTVHTRAVWGKRLDRNILHAVAETGADLVFKTTHHHNPIKQLLLTNTDWQLIRHCEAPLWLVKRADRSIQTICAGIDPLHEADKPAALDFKLVKTARALASNGRRTIQVAHCYSPLPQTLVYDASVIADYDGYAEDVRKRHAAAFEEFGAKLDLPAERRHLLQGYAEEVMPEFVEEQNIDLLVMGAVSRSRLDAALVGHTAERLLDDVPCDVLVVKPDGFVDPSKP
ncbi:universal stress protein E [Halopseudomonas xinjiangensis]|uniref:Universal stress protein E n=1 Tax=Halopseudomonas xinjiangensis TaxID=487184 RepID=A0A1H1N3X2_9GAMM|nr:universal stress protein [Halopseudomonas xinjiangensis]SDR93617.1 universal stress protein E [Halopseudomonas xinjiangensis]